ncbi:MAG: EAL domain-containing protein [Coriobacteriia bacterium]|nr:EAL domain-containing protein [Coriobacteriia bacterium]
MGIEEAMSEAADTMLFDSAPCALLLVEAESGRIVRANRTAAAMMGVRPEEAIGTRLTELFDEQGAKAVERALAGVHDPERSVVVQSSGGRDLRVRISESFSDANGGRRVVMIALAPLDAAPAARLSVIHADRKAVFSALAERTSGACGGCWLLFLDVDRFRSIVAEVGHIDAESVLDAIAERISVMLRSDDVLVRFGADEFIAFLAGSRSEDEAVAVARRMAEEVDDVYDVGGSAVRASVSAGIAAVSGDIRGVEDAVRSAEMAARAAKAAGRAQWRVYDPSLAYEAEHAIELGRALRDALERGEFVLHYQPVVDLTDRSVVGAEALLRWDRPGEGLVMPGAFIRVAEESGLIREIGAWVIHEACRQLRAWRDRGHGDLWVSVNVSAMQLRSGEVVEQLRAALADTSVRPDACVLEVTETAIVEDPQVAYEVLREVRALGSRVALDDFGTGYSSLSRMREMPFNELKIDRSFLERIDTQARDAALVAAMVALAHSFESRAIAEGVESPEQLGYLKALKCDMAQGYVFSRPVQPESFDSLIENGPTWLAR